MSQESHNSQEQDGKRLGESLWSGVGSWIGYRGKTLWDLLALFIVPLSLALIALWFNNSQTNLDREIAEQRIQEDRSIAGDRRREEILQSYLGRMEYLILEKDLRTADSDSDVSIIGRAFTKTTLRELDGKRKGALLLFLYEAGLVDKDDPVIDLGKANFSGIVLFAPTLSGVNLNGVSLVSADLKEADFVGADLGSSFLQNADLTDADLSGANLQDAVISSEQLRQVKSLEGATMPDGTLYDGRYDE